MGRRALLNADQVREIRRLLWENEKPAAIAEMFDVSQPIVSNIKTGKYMPEVAWPDGTVGEMPQYMQNLHRKTKKRTTAVKKHVVVNSGSPKKFRYNTVGLEEFDEYKRIMAMARAEGFYDFNEYMEFKAKQKEEEEHKREQEAMAKQMDEWRRQSEEHRKKIENGEIVVRDPPDPYSDPLDPDKQQMLDWDYVLEVAGDLGIVQIAAENINLQLAIRAMFYQLKPAHWKEPYTIREIGKLAGRFKRFADGERVKIRKQR